MTSRPARGWLLAAGLLFCGLFSTGFPAPSEVREVGSELQPLWDDWLIESLENVRHVLHRPEPREVVLRRDRPWEDHAIYNPVVIKDGYRYRMWYRARAVEKPILTAYAESLDGIHWVKPKLGLIEHDGSRENNLVWPVPGGIGRSVSVVKDGNPEADPQERYKAITNQGTKLPSGREIALLYGLVSPDGLRWRMVRQGPIVVPPLGDGAFDSHNIILWDEARGRYSIYARGWYRRGSRPLDGKTVGRGPYHVLIGRPSGVVEKISRIRDIRRFTSKDFRDWSEPEYIGLGETPLEHLYKNSAVPYYRRPDLILMFPKRYHPTRKFHADWPAPGQSEVVFMFSRDGVNFDRRFMEAFLRPGPNPLNWHERAIQVGPTLVPTAPGEMSLYYAEQGKTDQVRIRRAVLREDGFVSLRAPYPGGAVRTRPLVFSGSRLFLNYSTSAAGSIRVEIQDEAGNPFPGYSLEDCPEIYGDEIEREVKWRAVSSVESLAGRSVRLMISMRDADLYSLRFR